MTDTNVLQDVQAYINKYVVLPNAERDSLILASWVLHSWTWTEAATTTPYIYVCSKGPQSGKTRLMNVLSSITQNPESSVNTTPATLMVITDENNPTLYFDELDMLYSGRSKDELTGLLNSGYIRGGYTTRRDGKGIIRRKTFSPKFLAGIWNGKIPPALESRLLPIIIERKRPEQSAEFFMQTEAVFEAEPILNRIEKWAEENMADLIAYRQHAVSGLGDRRSEILWPLLAIAHTFGMREELADAARSTYAEYDAVHAEEDPGTDALEALALLFSDTKSTKVHTDAVLALLELPKATGGRVLADTLLPFGITSKNVRVGTRNAKGYHYDDCYASFRQYGIDVPGLMGQ